MTDGASFVVAIDGPAGSGKGTLAGRLARRFGLAYLDTGALYRAAAFLVLDAGADPADKDAAVQAARRVEHSLLADPGLRGEAVGRAASRLAALPEVRDALLAVQRAFARHPPPPAAGAVLDGRDIGTVVCPGASLKLFITASVETRAGRRFEQLRAAGMPAIYEAVLQDMKERDARDSGRSAAPLKVAPDAVVIDTTTLDAEEVLERSSDLIARALAASRAASG